MCFHSAGKFSMHRGPARVVQQLQFGLFIGYVFASKLLRSAPRNFSLA
jgi:hypothetical protein